MIMNHVRETWIIIPLSLCIGRWRWRWRRKMKKKMKKEKDEDGDEEERWESWFLVWVRLRDKNLKTHLISSLLISLLSLCKQLLFLPVLLSQEKVRGMHHFSFVLSLIQTALHDDDDDPVFKRRWRRSSGYSSLFLLFLRSSLLAFRVKGSTIG